MYFPAPLIRYLNGMKLSVKIKKPSSRYYSVHFTIVQAKVILKITHGVSDTPNLNKDQMKYENLLTFT